VGCYCSFLVGIALFSYYMIFYSLSNPVSTFVSVSCHDDRKTTVKISNESILKIIEHFINIIGIVD